MIRRVRLEPEAEDEIVEAALHYDQKGAGLGDEFVAAARAAQRRIQRWPNVGSFVDSVDRSLQVRRIPMARFPYQVVYVRAGDEVHIIAVAYDGREPGYWIDRLRR